LARRVVVIEASGCTAQGWIEGDLAHGPAEGPSGHVFKIDWDTHRYVAPPAERPALKNLAKRYLTSPGCAGGSNS
jgi:catechol 2,3-dioxygenase